MQCIPWAVGCSEWGACLTPFKFEVCWGLGANNKCSKMSFEILWGTLIRISWTNLVKIDRWKVAKKLSGLPHKKNSGSAGLVCTHFADGAWNFMNRTNVHEIYSFVVLITSRKFHGNPFSVLAKRQKYIFCHGTDRSCDRRRCRRRDGQGKNIMHVVQHKLHAEA